MKKTFKLVAIFIASIIGIVAGSLAVYFLIDKYKVYHIYDVRIVNPIDRARSYVYTDSQRTYEYMKNQVVFMTNPSENNFEIGVYAHTSNESKDVVISSSDENVARLNFSRGHCYVQYYRAGKTTISASIGGVVDTIDVIVYDNTAEYFSVYDSAYYGDYLYNFPNRLICYTDEISYGYDYEVSNYLNGALTSEINNELLRVDTASIDTRIFSSAKIDPNSRKLMLKCRAYKTDEKGNDIVDEDGKKTRIDETVDTTLVIQSYYKMDDGTIKVNKNFTITVHVVADTPEYLQMQLATSPDFDNDAVYTYTQNLSNQIFNDEDIDVVDEILANKKEVKYLTSENKIETYNTFFSEKVTTLYVRFRKVYTNGNIIYLNPLTFEENPFILKYYLGNSRDAAEIDVAGQVDFGSNSYFKVTKNNNYYMLKLDKNFFDENQKLTLEFSLLDYYNLDPKKFEFRFKTLFIDENASDEDVSKQISDFYSYNEKTGVYTFKYWDKRNRFYGEIYDTNGFVIGFSKSKIS